MTTNRIQKSIRTAVLSCGLFIAATETFAANTTVRITIESAAPDNGTILTPFWLGIQDGSFDLFNPGETASEGIERMAEDGNFAALRSDFETSGAGIDGILTGLGMEGTPPLFFPGQTNSWTVSLDGKDPANKYFSYAAMILPSNDAFVANGVPAMLFDENGMLIEQEIVILGSAVYDAGTEINDEIAENVPVLGQSVADSGTAEGGVISMHPGFLNDGGVLSMFPSADFTQDGYEVARIRIERVEPYPVTLKVTIENLAPADGTVLTPFWLGFQDGSFDFLNAGETASEGVERMAEDGNLAVLREVFAASSAGAVDGVLTGLGMDGTPPLFFQGQENSWTISIDANDPRNRYLSYASMILPSNDAFVANDDPMAYELFDASGTFMAQDILIAGTSVYDAGTEVNDEVAENVPMLGQSAPNTGTTEGGVITMHPGFLNNGAILSAFSAADFLADGYQVARIKVEKIPAKTVTLKVKVTSLAPTDGTVLTPFWFGFHDGSFDLFDSGAAASSAVERFAEDGDFAQLRTDFSKYSLAGTDGVLTGLGMDGTPPLFFPGQVNKWKVNIDANSPSSRYLSYAAMILPSNDAFIANSDPAAIELFDADGNFMPQEFMISGNQVYDAGTEVNDEMAAYVPLLGQMAPDSGMDENSVIVPHPGFISGGPVLTAFPEANFLASNYQVAMVSISKVYNPFGDYTADEDGAKETADFGTVFDQSYPYVYQGDHGWLYISVPEEGSRQFWTYNFMDNLGWIYINLDSYPLVYHIGLGWLYYYEGSSDPRAFYDYSEAEWISVPSGS